jgi:hypothetical protein
LRRLKRGATLPGFGVHRLASAIGEPQSAGAITGPRPGPPLCVGRGRLGACAGEHSRRACAPFFSRLVSAFVAAFGTGGLCNFGDGEVVRAPFRWPYRWPAFS